MYIVIIFEMYTILIVVVHSNIIVCNYHTIQHYVMKFVNDLLQVGDLHRVSSYNKTDHHNITEILLKVMLRTINSNSNPQQLGLQKQVAIPMYNPYTIKRISD